MKRFTKPNPIPRVPLESDIQAAFIVWTKLAQARYPSLKLGFAVPNGGARAISTALRLKAEGVNPGIPDWILPVPRKSHTGLAIEFKRPGGRATPIQQEKINHLRSEGWQVHVLTDWEAAKNVVIEYLDA